MLEVRSIGLKDRLWHRLRADLASVVPSLGSDDRLICCCCGRLLPFEAFSLEHIIPQQVLALDPPAIKAAATTLMRSGYTLLCNTALKVKGKPVLANGCNSWKGKYFDHELKKLFKGTALERRPKPDRHAIVSGISAAYLAMFSKFGYQVALTSAGLALRKQFFTPGRLIPDIPILSQLLMTGLPWDDTISDPEIWSDPFLFSFDEQGFCTVVIRNFGVNLPISRDPRVPLASVLPFAPIRHILRPNFQVFFD